MAKKYTILSLLLIALATVGCEEPTSCDLTTEAPLRAGFFSQINDSVEIDTTLKMSAIGIGAEDTLITRQTSTDSIVLELNPYVDTVSYILVLNDQIDTFSVYYDRTLVLISELCGFTTNYEIRQIINSNNLIDSVAIIKSEVTTTNEQHLKIYF